MILITDHRSCKNIIEIISFIEIILFIEISFGGVIEI